MEPLLCGLALSLAFRSSPSWFYGARSEPVWTRGYWEEDNVAHHALKHHLRYRVFYCEWDRVLQNEHRAASKKTLTNN